MPENEKTETTVEMVSEEELLKSLETLEQVATGDIGDLTKSVVAPDPDHGEVGEGAEKAFAEAAVEGSENIRKAVEVSDFLSALVQEIGTAIDGIKTEVSTRLDAMEKSIGQVAEFNKSMADTFRKSMQFVSEGIKGSTEGLEDLKKSVEDMGTQPAHGRKSKVTVLEKSNLTETTDKRVLSKKAVLAELTDRLLKGVEGISATDIIRFETTGDIRADLAKSVGWTAE